MSENTLLIPLANNVGYIFNDSPNLKFVMCSKLIACLLNPSVVIWGHFVGYSLGEGGGGLLPHMSIVVRGSWEWLWKVANINDKNNSAAVYVGSTLKVHNPLFSVGTLLWNKLMQCFYWSIQSKWKECFWVLCTFRPTKTYKKGVWQVS